MTEKACCPDCGSNRAVAKWEAWDALCEVPPKTKEEIERLKHIAAVAQRILLARCAAPPGEIAVQAVPVSLLDRLADALARTGTERESVIRDVIAEGVEQDAPEK